MHRHIFYDNIDRAAINNCIFNLTAFDTMRIDSSKDLVVFLK